MVVIKYNLKIYVGILKYYDKKIFDIQQNVTDVLEEIDLFAFNT